jgi:hypothetical protein
MAKLARLLLCLGSLGHLLIYLIAAPEHVVDAAWPDHARFHILQAMFWIAGLDLVATAIAWRLPDHRDRWALAALCVVWFTAHASYFIAIAALPDGRPPNLSADLSLAAALLLYTTGLGLALRGSRT